VLPTAARGAAKVLRRVRAEKVVSADGERSHAIAWAFKHGGHGFRGANQAGPQGLLLQGIKHEAGFGWERVVLPCRAEKSFPVDDGGSGPCGKALGAARAVELVLQGAGGAFTGGHHHASGGEPLCDLLRWIRLRGCPHSSVIRHRAGPRQNGRGHASRMAATAYNWWSVCSADTQVGIERQG